MPNGSCFQIASRLAIEVLEICKRFRASGGSLEGKPNTSILDGFDSTVVTSAEDLRSLICEWYHRGLEAIVPQLGFQDEGSKRPFTRGDLLALEAIRTSMDVPENGPKRLSAVRAILDRMKRKGTWASTPEQIALSSLTKATVEVQTPKDGSLELRDSTKPSAGSSGSQVIRLHFYNNHQDLLVTDEEQKILLEWFPEDASRFIHVSEKEKPLTNGPSASASESHPDSDGDHAEST